MIQRIKETAFPWTRNTILIVDDSVQYMTLLEKFINRELPKAKVVKINDAVKALEFIRKIKRGAVSSPKIAVLDRNMSGLTGDELSVLLKNADSTIKTVLNSGYVSKSMIEAEMRRFKLDFVVEKDSDFRPLTSRLNQIMHV